MRIITFLVFLLSSGCTASLWRPEHVSIPVDGFYVNEDNCQILVSAQEKALVFDNECDLGKALALSRDQVFFPEFHNVRITRDNRLRGQISLTLMSPSPSYELLDTLSGIGFVDSEEKKELVMIEDLEGRLYNLEGSLPMQKLDKTYHIAAAIPRKPSDIARNIIVTPAAITIDAVVTVPAAFVLVTSMAAGSPPVTPPLNLP